MDWAARVAPTDAEMEMVREEQARARTFHTKLRLAASELGYLQKKGFNSHFKYKFVSESDVKAAVKGALDRAGLVMESVQYTPIGECTGKSSTLVCTVVITDEGQSGRAVFNGIGAGTDSSDKAPMKACAASLKYALTSGFLIPTGDDPEKDEDVPEAAPSTPTPSQNTEAELVKRIAQVSSTDELKAIKPDVIYLQASDKDAYDRVVAVYRARNKELTK